MLRQCEITIFLIKHWLRPCEKRHTFVSAAVVTQVTLVRFLIRVKAGVTLQIGVDLELGRAHMTDERTVARVSTQVDDQLTRVATGVRTDLTPGGGKTASY